MRKIETSSMIMALRGTYNPTAMCLKREVRLMYPSKSTKNINAQIKKGGP
jgi:hypothetical protein